MRLVGSECYAGSRIWEVSVKGKWKMRWIGTARKGRKREAKEKGSRIRLMDGILTCAACTHTHGIRQEGQAWTVCV
jgi:hypothetical protein